METNGYLRSIAKHVNVLNSELGKVQTDMRWVKRCIYYLASVITGIGIKFIVFL